VGAKKKYKKMVTIRELGTVSRYRGNNSLAARHRSIARGLPYGTVAKAVGRTIARNLPYVGRAFRAGEMVKRMYDRTFKRSKGTQTQPVKRRSDKYFTTGRLAGKFKRRRTGKRKDDRFLRNGFKNTMEITGVVSDPDCVYVGHSTSSGNRILTAFLHAALRKLFARAGVKVERIDERIDGYHTFSSDAYKLVLEVDVIRTGNTGATSEYTLAASESIYSIVGDVANGVAPNWAGLVDFWRNYCMFGSTLGSSGSVQLPRAIKLYRNDRTPANLWIYSCEINFFEENINLFIKSDLKIQNRTLSATGGTDENDISNNPIIGRSYQFNSGAPLLKGINNPNGLITGVNDKTGVITIRAASLDSGGTNPIFKEPPPPKIFANLSRDGKAVLQPGQIKTDTLIWSTRMQCHKFFDRLRWSPDDNAVAGSKSFKTAGKCALFALEDVINVNGTQNISIAYECNRYEMCYLTTMKTSVSIGSFQNTVQNELPPA